MKRALLLLLLAAPALAGEGGIVSGRVVDEAGRPIAGACVGSAKYAHTETDAEGRFSFEVTWGPRGSFWVSHNDFVGTKFACEVPSSANEIVLRRGLVISGRLAFPDGKPLAHAVVEAWYPEHNQWPRSEVRTGPDGKFLFTGFRSDERCVLRCLGARAEAVAGDQERKLILPHSVIALAVINEEGAPLTPEELCFLGKSGEETIHGGPALELGDGRYLLPGNGADRVLASPVHSGHELPIFEVPTRGRPRLIPVSTILRPLLQPARLILRVRDARGRIPERIQVNLWNEAGASPPTVDDRRRRLDDGCVVLEGLPPGSWRAYLRPDARDKSYRMGTQFVVELGVGEAHERKVVLPLGGRLRIRVRGAPGDEISVHRWKIEIRSADGVANLGSFPYPRPDEWSTNGDPLSPGRYTARVLREDELVAEKAFEITARMVTSLRIAAPK